MFSPIQHFAFIRQDFPRLAIYFHRLTFHWVKRMKKKDPCCHVLFGFFFFINYALKGLLVASSHTIKLCRSFHIKKKKIPAVNLTSRSFWISPPCLSRIKLETRNVWNNAESALRNAKILWGKEIKCCWVGAYASEYILQIDIHRMVNKVWGRTPI